MTQHQLELEVLQQFRIIYGTMRHYFKELEECCGLPGAQMWLLQEVERKPEIGVTELGNRLGIHQSTCSQLVEKLVSRGCLMRKKQTTDQRRIGLLLTEDGKKALSALPGPAEGVLPEALAALHPVVLQTLNINLNELVRHLSGSHDAFAATPLAELLRDQ